MNFPVVRQCLEGQESHREPSEELGEEGSISRSPSGTSPEARNARLTLLKKMLLLTIKSQLFFFL